MAQLHENGFPDNVHEATDADWRDVTARLSHATMQLCEMQGQIRELVDANLRLRHELSEATLALVLTAPHEP